MKQVSTNTGNSALKEHRSAFSRDRNTILRKNPESRQTVLVLSTQNSLCAQQLQLAEKDARIQELLFERKLLTETNCHEVADLNNRIECLNVQEEKLRESVNCLETEKCDKQRVIECYENRICALEKDLRSLYQEFKEIGKEGPFCLEERQSNLNLEISHQAPQTNNQHSKMKSSNQESDGGIKIERSRLFQLLQKCELHNKDLCLSIQELNTQAELFNNSIIAILDAHSGSQIDIRHKDKSAILTTLQQILKDARKQIKLVSHDNQHLRHQLNKCELTTRGNQAKLNHLVTVVNQSNHKVNQLMDELNASKEQLERVQVICNHEKQTTKRLEQEIKKISGNSEQPILMSSFKRNEREDQYEHYPCSSGAIKSQVIYKMSGSNSALMQQIQQLKEQLKVREQKLMSSEQKAQKYCESFGQIFHKANEINEEMLSSTSSRYERSFSKVSGSKQDNNHDTTTQ